MDTNRDHTAEQSKPLPGFSECPELQTFLEHFTQSTGIPISILNEKIDVITSLSSQTHLSDLFATSNTAKKHLKKILRKIIGGLDEKQAGSIGTLFPGVHAGILTIPFADSKNYLLAGPVLFSELDAEIYPSQAKKYKIQTEDFLRLLYVLPVISEEQFKVYFNLLQGTVVFLEAEPKEGEIKGEAYHPKGGKVNLAQLLNNIESINSQHFTESLLNAIPTPVFFKDNDGRYLGCNRAFSDLMGVTSEEIRGKTVHELWPEQQADTYRKKDSELLKNPQLQTFEHVVTDKNGKTRPVIFSKEVFYNDSGAPAGIVGAFMDISSQKEAEQSIRESETRYRTIFETSNVAVWEEDFSVVKAEIEILKSQGIRDFKKYLENYPEFVSWASENIIVRDVNEAALQVTGASNKSELLGPLSRFLEPEMVVMLKREIEAIARGERYFEREAEVHVFGGELRNVMVTISFPPHANQYDRVLVNTIDITQIKKSESALRESEERFRSLAEMLPEAVFETNEDMILTYANQAAYKLFGYEPDEVVENIKSIDLIAPQDQQRALENLTRRLGEEDPGSIEYKAIRKNGTKFPILFHANSIVHEKEFKGIRGIAIDISKTKQAEEALRNSESKYRSLVEKSFQGVVIAQDDPLRLAFASKPMEAITGYSPEELTDLEPEQLASLLHPEDRERFFHNFHSRIKGELVPPRAEYRTIDKQGNMRWVELYSTLIDYQGSLSTQSVFLDITDRKHMENELRETNETLQAMMHSSPFAIITHNLEGKVTLWNPAAEEIFSWKEEEVLGKINPIIPPDEMDFFEQNIQELREGKLVQMDLLRATKKGVLLDVRLTAAPLYDTENNVTGVVTIFEDITRQKLAEQEKAKIQEQYRQAQRLEAVGRLAGGVAHDLNNLLTPILLYAEMLLEDQDPSEQSYHPVSEILQAGLRARDLVNQLLAYSRKQNLEYKPIHLNKTVKRFEKLLRRTIREDIEIRLKLNPLNFMVMADVGQIEQVIMNLAVNAQDAMPEGGTLTIQTEGTILDELYAQNHPEVVPGNYVMLAINDTGLGMDEQIQEQIFEPFFTTKGDHGTGLGLSTVYGIIKQHEGHIWVYSEIERGSCFKIYLPAVQKSSNTEKPVSQKPGDLSGHETILLVEDNDQVRNLTLTILQNHGYDVLTAENGNQALEILKTYTDPVHLLLTDVIMPEMNGRELYDNALNHRPDLRVLYMSGYTNDVIGHRGVLEKGIAYIQKPYSLRGLTEKIRELLNGV